MDDSLLEAAFENEGEIELIAAEILARYVPGELITHDSLKQLFKIEMPKSSDFEDDESFIKAIEFQTFKYMTLTSNLRNHLLKYEDFYLNNVRGQGYKILLPKEQQAYAFDSAMKDIKKTLSESREIMLHVRFNEVDNETRAKGNDLAVKLSAIKQFIDTARK